MAKDKDIDKKPSRRGRPPKYSPERVDKFLTTLCSINPKTGVRYRLSDAAEAAGVTMDTVTTWIRMDIDGFRAKYIEAQRAMALFLYDEILTISDDKSKDTITDPLGNPIADKEWINRSRLMVDTRKFALAKLLPKIFGDNIKVDHEVKGGITINIQPAQLAGNANMQLATEEDQVDLKRDISLLTPEAILDLKRRGIEIEDAQIEEEYGDGD